VVRLKSRKREALVQTGLRLESEILNRLRSGGRGLSDEIRDRLERTFREDAIDPVTRELRDGLLSIAALLRSDFAADWHASPWAYKAFAAAIVQRLAEYEPPARPPSPSVDALFDPPETIGRLRERDDQRAHDYPQLKASKQRKTARLLSARHLKAKKEREHD
jgi:hypothetical protein